MRKAICLFVISWLSTISLSAQITSNDAIYGRLLGTGVGTALGINVGSSGSPVLNGGALGTPSSGSVPITLLNGTINGIGAVSTDGLIVSNSTAAAAGAQQYSPRVRLTGQGWKTASTAASQAVDWILENQPVQGSTSPATRLAFSSQINAAGYGQKFAFGSDGRIYGNDTNAYISLSSGGLGFTLFSDSFSLSDFGVSVIGASASQLTLGTGGTVAVGLAEGSNIYGHRNGATAQIVNIYNTYTSATSFERLMLDWQTTSNVAMIYTQKGSGGGTARVLQFNYGGTTTSAISIPITSGDITLGGSVLPTGYKSADGTVGVTVTTCTGFKNGLCISGT